MTDPAQLADLAINQPDVALIFEGGGMRNSYTAPMVVELLARNLNFGCVYGISAGSSHTVNYLVRDATRARASFVELVKYPRFGGWGSFLRGTGYFNSPYLYEELIENAPAGDPMAFDWDTFAANPAVLVPAAVAKQWADPAQSQAISEELLQDIAVTVTNVTLPVSFAKAWPTLKETIEATKPNIVIATGLKHAARGVMLERCATNLMDAIKPDADNVIPRREPIDPNGPAAYWTRLPLRSILNDFTDDSIPATLSSDAGTFVCNSLFYNLLNWTATQERVLGGFVSFPPVVPAHSSQHGLPLDQQIAAGRDVVREAVRYYLKPSSSDILIA